MLWQVVVCSFNLYKTSVYYDIDKKATIEIGPAITRNNGCIILFYLTSLSCPKIKSSTTETGLWKDHVRQNQLSDHVRQNYMSQSNVRKNYMSQSNFFLMFDTRLKLCGSRHATILRQVSHSGGIYIEPLILNQNSKHTRVNRYEDFIMCVGGPTQNPLQCLADSSLVHDQLGHLQTE